MKNIISLFTIFLLMSCASTSIKNFKKDIAKTKDFTQLNGTYKKEPFYSYENIEQKNYDSLYKTHFHEIIQNKAPYYEKVETLAYDKVVLNFKPNQKLEFTLFLKDSLVKENTIDFKVKKGIIKLSNSFYKCEGIPFIFGGCRNGIVRLALSKDGNLIMNKSYDQYGALILIIGAGIQQFSTYQYKKL